MDGSPRNLMMVKSLKCYVDGSPRNLNSSKSQALYGWAPRSLMWASQVSSAIWMSLLAAQEFQRNWGIGSLCGCIYTDFAGRDVQCTVLCCTVQYYIQSSFWAHGRRWLDPAPLWVWVSYSTPGLAVVLLRKLPASLGQASQCKQSGRVTCPTVQCWVTADNTIKTNKMAALLTSTLIFCESFI